MKPKSDSKILWLPGTSPGVSEFFSAASFWVPDHLDTSAWAEHGPFAFWLIEALRPQCFVELGTHHGYSYFCVCQAVQRLGLDTRCYAVDTWKGDQHAGFYGEEVYLKVCAGHDRYSSFSRLVRSTFDEALEHFQDGSIDLLHIDGQHLYEDVKHDFESWFPKLSDGSVVILHDTNVKENHFGVGNYWEGIKKNFPHFEFLHGHGLGVLGVGKSLPDPVRSLFAASSDKKVTGLIREVYSRLGSSLKYKFLQIHLTQEHQQLQEQVRQKTGENQLLRAELTQKKEEILKIERFLTRQTIGPEPGRISRESENADSISSRRKVVLKPEQSVLKSIDKQKT